MEMGLVCAARAERQSWKAEARVGYAGSAYEITDTGEDEDDEDEDDEDAPPGPWLGWA
jgi:hypothetical protein